MQVRVKVWNYVRYNALLQKSLLLLTRQQQGENSGVGHSWDETVRHPFREHPAPVLNPMRQPAFRNDLDNIHPFIDQRRARIRYTRKNADEILLEKLH